MAAKPSKTHSVTGVFPLDIPLTLTPLTFPTTRTLFTPALTPGHPPCGRIPSEASRASGGYRGAFGWGMRPRVHTHYFANAAVASMSPEPTVAVTTSVRSYLSFASIMSTYSV